MEGGRGLELCERTEFFRPPTGPTGPSGPTDSQGPCVAQHSSSVAAYVSQFCGCSGCCLCCRDDFLGASGCRRLRRVCGWRCGPRRGVAWRIDELCVAPVRPGPDTTAEREFGESNRPLFRGEAVHEKGPGARVNPDSAHLSANRTDNTRY